MLPACCFLCRAVSISPSWRCQWFVTEAPAEGQRTQHTHQRNMQGNHALPSSHYRRVLGCRTHTDSDGHFPYKNQRPARETLAAELRLKNAMVQETGRGCQEQLSCLKRFIAA